MEPQKRARLEITDRQGNRIVSESSAAQAIATLQGTPLSANRGTSLNLDWVESVRVNLNAVERRAATIVTRRTVKKDWQIAWLLRAITCMDLTTLSGDDTEERVRRLCAKARQPVQQELVEKLGIEELRLHVGAVCVYPLFCEQGRRGARWKARIFMWPRFPPDFRRAFRRSKSASRKSGDRWKPARKRLTW